MTPRTPPPGVHPDVDRTILVSFDRLFKLIALKNYKAGELHHEQERLAWLIRTSRS